MTTETPPFQHDFDLGDLSRGGAEIRIAATAEDLPRIARWADIRGVESFGATLRLAKHSTSNFSLDAELTADVVQDCVVTLEPVRSHIARAFRRDLHLTAPVRHRGGDTAVSPALLAGEDDAPEEIDSLHYDLAAPLLEELALALDPYPRAPGVEFAAPAEPAELAESPFAVLKSLKKRS